MNKSLPSFSDCIESDQKWFGTPQVCQSEHEWQICEVINKWTQVIQSGTSRSDLKESEQK